VSEQDVHCALLSGDPQDQLVIAYNLVIDNRRIADETAKLQIRDFYLASSPPSEADKVVMSPPVGFEISHMLHVILVFICIFIFVCVLYYCSFLIKRVHFCR